MPCTIPLPHRLLVLSPESPLPPRHGGRVDLARRLAALRAQGVEVMLVFWASPKATAELEAVSSALNELAHEVIVLEELSLRGYLRAGARYPLWVGQRAMTAQAAAGVAARARAFGAAAILLDNLNGAAGLDRLRSILPLPYAYRAHNVEHRYAASQTAGARGLRARLIGWLVRAGMLRLETRIRREAVQVLDISPEDLAFWQGRGERHGHWSPVLFDKVSAARLSETAAWQPEVDVGYLGNLYAPNNLAGLRWFLAEVVPILRQSRATISIRIAGAQPDPALWAACQAAGVSLLADPADAVTVLRGARVLINPVFAGSGTNVKATEMLFTPAALVSTPQGLAGLPEEARACFAQAGTAADFAQAILAAARPGNRDLARKAFLDTALAPFLAALSSFHAAGKP